MVRTSEVAGLTLGMLLLVTSLAVTATIGHFQELIDPDLRIRVDSISTIDTDGDIPLLTDHHLVVLSLNITLGNDQEAYPLSIPHFFAITIGGQNLWCEGMLVDVPTTILPGGSIDIEIYFQVQNGDRIAITIYQTPSGETIPLDLSTVSYS